MKTALTDLGVQKLAPGTYFDEKVPAFGIRVGKHRRTWLIYKGKTRKVLTLGHYPSLSLQEARRRAMLALAAPSTDRPSISFPDAKDEFLEQGVWRASTKRVLTSSLSHFLWKGQLGNPNGTAGAITWQVPGLMWLGANPTQSTAANKCELYSFDITQGSSTGPTNNPRIFGQQSPAQ